MPASVAAKIDTDAAQTRQTRFTIDGSDALEQHIAKVCGKFLWGIQCIIPSEKLEGLALGGGYGRGEGGVLRATEGDKPYNDLEFYIFVRGHRWRNERRYARALHELAETLSVTAEIEVEFKIISTAELRRSPQSLFYYDLIAGHRWFRGDESLLRGCEHHRSPETIPLSEATRLLMNRCSGLLFAREKLEKESVNTEDLDFITRNIAKTKLALGDAVLIAFGQFHWSCRERNRRLDLIPTDADLPWLEAVRQHHAAGVAFKLRPQLSPLSHAELRANLREVSLLASHVWLWLEKRRLGCDFQSMADYAARPVDKWPHTRKWRNCLANVKVFGPRGLFMACHLRHPRERILRALTYLLWVESGTSHQLTQQVQRDLRCSKPKEVVFAYRERWKYAS